MNCMSKKVKRNKGKLIQKEYQEKLVKRLVIYAEYQDRRFIYE